MQKPDEGTYKHTMVYIAIHCTQYLLQNQIWQSAGKYVYYAICLDKTQPNQSTAKHSNINCRHPRENIAIVKGALT